MHSNVGLSRIGENLMTKKDYELIASEIKEMVEMTKNYDSPAYNVVHTLAHNLAGTLKKENERFDYHKFLKACGY
jgi:hypothetical protein